MKKWKHFECPHRTRCFMTQPMFGMSPEIACSMKLFMRLKIWFTKKKIIINASDSHFASCYFWLRLLRAFWLLIQFYTNFGIHSIKKRAMGFMNPLDLSVLLTKKCVFSRFLFFSIILFDYYVSAPLNEPQLRLFDCLVRFSWKSRRKSEKAKTYIVCTLLTD